MAVITAVTVVEGMAADTAADMAEVTEVVATVEGMAGHTPAARTDMATLTEWVGGMDFEEMREEDGMNVLVGSSARQTCELQGHMMREREFDEGWITMKLDRTVITAFEAVSHRCLESQPMITFDATCAKHLV